MTRSKQTCLAQRRLLMQFRGTLQLTVSASVCAERAKNLLTFHQLQLATAQLVAAEHLGHAICCQQAQ